MGAKSNDSMPAMKTVVVTGATRGLGAAIARTFAESGARIIACGRDLPAGRQLVESLGAQHRFQLLDVRDPEGWQRVAAETVDEFGAPSILVNNAGVMRAAPITQMSVDDIRAVIDTNLVGALLGMGIIGGAMVEGGNGGAIVNVSSTTGITAGGRLVAYAASKWGLRGATKAAAADFAPHGIRVVSIHPGATATDMLASSGLSNDEIVSRHGAQLLIRRVADPAEIARAIAMLASDQAAYMTGTEFVIDGGVTAN